MTGAILITIVALGFGLSTVGRQGWAGKILAVGIASGLGVMAAWNHV